MKIIRAHINFYERITNYEWLVNVDVDYTRHEWIPQIFGYANRTYHCTLQFRIPEYTDDMIRMGIESCILEQEQTLKLTRKFNEGY